MAGINFHTHPIIEQSGQAHFNSPNPLNLEGVAFYTPFRSVLNKRHWRLGPLRAEHSRLSDIIPFVRVRLLPGGLYLIGKS